MRVCCRLLRPLTAVLRAVMASQARPARRAGGASTAPRPAHADRVRGTLGKFGGQRTQGDPALIADLPTEDPAAGRADLSVESAFPACWAWESKVLLIHAKALIGLIGFALRVIRADRSRTAPRDLRGTPCLPPTTVDRRAPGGD